MSAEAARTLTFPGAPPLRVLMVDDNPDDRALVRRALRKDYPGIDILEVFDRRGLDLAIEDAGFDIVITDFQLNWSNGLFVLREIKRRDPERPVIMFTGTGSEEVAVEAMKNGLDDYVLKSPRHLVRLSASVRSALERRRERQVLREAEETLRSLKKAVDSLPIGVTIADPQGLIVYTNPAEARLHGYSVAELLGRPARMLVPREYARPLTSDAISEITPWKRERINLRKDGSTFPAQLTSDVVRAPTGEPIGLVTTCEDITERKWIEAQLRRNAFYDGLTSLPNRALFMDRLEHALGRTRRRPDHVFAVLFLDLDRFKLVNDSFGHGVGDRLLMETARRVQKVVRPSDTVSRLGGDEFAILTEEIRDVADAVHIAERTQAELGAPYHVDGHEIFISASIGIALATQAYGQPGEILRDADTAMYRAKAGGKARHEVFGDDMLSQVRGLLRLQGELRRALDRGELCLHYQPLVSLTTGEVVGAEALVRWQHPQRGLLLPAAFIGVAEESGLISPLGEWAFREACAQGRAWQDAGLAGLRVSVNVSPNQFRQAKLAEQIRRALAATGFEPMALDVELTESALMESVEESVKSARELKALGVRIALDDFGTGYSSLSYLRRFPVDVLKIDQTFVGSVTTDARDAAIASSVIALAHSLTLRVIAEGVETEEQRAFLRDVGCDEMQGHVVSPALPADAFAQMVRRTRGSEG
jgi:diguanylate cyclase (GGDEF)-like protein/PAS domain S-box-containing protein